ncbi:hypothetical protein BN7_6573 [Wickerhamomyces ciferrii]|uniref:Arrestin-like N-terminal domain-containing protein n=1 Tax=Wickerhamomyces ciferrii (strain ATCC 14091 / BCRC 22168 / CBS 111 / JCM 3599 / NBRC 0793 / NRRL Y-1031 F-60-10) TaxID=1206466 RepID=K0KUS9_WICCF|nr:uncharacterized protein BN7_6573 [Wickerhamomyces ciferrii]CCH46966.1 hypothetical protein BN7_6573 [Wickerhamomyces ciferrii]
MSSGTVDITIQLNNTNGYKYRPLDVIRGRVSLKVHKEISVKEVTVKFSGVSRSEVQVNESRLTANELQFQARKAIKTEAHIVAYDEVVIFPPPNVRKVSSNKEFTLTPGDYVYDFAFKIPLRNICYLTKTGDRATVHGHKKLPPSMDIDGIGNIKYQIRVIVDRASWSKPNPQESKSLLVTTFDPLIEDIISNTKLVFLKNSIEFSDKVTESYEVPVRESSSKKPSQFIKSLFGNKRPARSSLAREYNVPFGFEARICSSPFLRIGKLVPQLMIFLTSKHGPERYRGVDNQTSGLGQLILDDFGIHLTVTYNLIAEGRTIQEARRYKLVYKKDLSLVLDLANLEPNPLFGTTANSNPFQLGIPTFIYENAVVPDVINPTFDTCNIKVDYNLNIWAKFREEKKSWHSGRVGFLTVPVTVLAGIPSPQEYIQMMKIPHHLAQQVLETYPPEAFRQPDDFTPLYDDTTAAPISLNVEESEPAKQDEKQNHSTEDEIYSSTCEQSEEILPIYESATKEQRE